MRDGYAGYDALRDFAADIVITDWVMAPMDGYEFTQMVRCAPDSPNPFVPIIMMTSRNLRDEVERARDIGPPDAWLLWRRRSAQSGLRLIGLTGPADAVNRKGASGDH